ncbi:MAG: hypothetical protein FWD90_00090 [Defluviitaleaceae bacterium]|nr:hypothetical protein [Defluviitaleaceae bacterium]
MKRVVLSNCFLVAGFLLFCYMLTASMGSRIPISTHSPSPGTTITEFGYKNPIYNYTPVLGPTLVILGIIIGFLKLRKESILAVIAPIFSFTPILLFLLMSIPFIGIAFTYAFFASLWGLGFCLIGFILGIISLCKGIKHKKPEIITSIIAILAPFGWILNLYLYVHFGGVIII